MASDTKQFRLWLDLNPNRSNRPDHLVKIKGTSTWAYIKRRLCNLLNLNYDQTILCHEQFDQPLPLNQTKFETELDDDHYHDLFLLPESELSAWMLYQVDRAWEDRFETQEDAEASESTEGDLDTEEVSRVD